MHDELLSCNLEKVEGSDDLFKEMKVYLSLLNNIVDSYHDTIKQQKDQLGQIFAQL